MSNAEWVSSTDPDARIVKMKDGRTHLGYKVEHTVDVESEFLLDATVYYGDEGDADTLLQSLTSAQQNVDEAGSETAIKEAAADKGYHKNETIAVCESNRHFHGRELVKREIVRSLLIASITAGLLAALIIAGSRRLAHFDAALVGYTFATLFAAFALAYRYAMWVQRPPTALYWKRGWQVFFRPQHVVKNLKLLGRRLVSVFVFNRFIWRRNRARGAAHWLIMWGCILAALITFPLVFGWVHFEMLPGDFETYRVFVFGFPTFSFPIDSLWGHIIFHGLVWSSLLVIPGVMIAMHRRMRDRDALVLQQFGEDFVPLILLFSVSVTGLMLVVSYQWMYGYGYDFLSLLHAVTVIVTLLWLPFGKFFHIFQRPAQIGVAFYRDVGKRSAQAHCARCGEAFASEMQVHDLIQVEHELGFDYETPDHKAGHYQWICPRCRRLLPALAQGRLWRESRTETEPVPRDE